MSPRELFEITRDESDALAAAGCCISSCGPIIMQSSRLIRAYVLALRELSQLRAEVHQPDTAIGWP